MVSKANIDKMKAVILFGAIFFTTSFQKKQLIVDNTGFGETRIGKTTISEVKRKYLFAKRTKTWKHGLFRTIDGGTIGKMFYHEKIRTKDGITFLFNYQAGVKDKIILSGLVFDFPIAVRTEKGIILGHSTFKDVEEKYGKVITQLHKSLAQKDYGQILFYSNKIIGQDSIDNNFIVTQIELNKDY